MKRFLVLSALVLLLAGCAAEEAYKDGVTLMGAGKPEESMAKFEEALTHDPRDVQYRSAWLRAREQVLTRSVEQADKLASKGAFDESRKLYRHALSLDPSYERALDGLAALDARMRQTGLMDDADSLLAKGKTEEASQKLARVLTEAPNDPRALGIKRAIDGRQAPPAAQKLAQSYQKPITIEFKDVSLKQVFEVLAHGSGLNFLFDKDVKTDQHTSIFLKNSTIEAAVRFVLLTNQLDSQVMDGNTVLIYPNNAAKQKDYQELDVRTFYLANAEAKTVANTLKTILKIRDIAVDEKLNMLVLRDTPDAIRMAEKLVAVEDVADPEVMLDVEVLEVQRNWLQDLGVQWPASATVTPTPLGTAVGTNTSTGTGTGTGTGVTGSSTSNSTSILSLHDLAHQTSRSLGVSLGGATANANVQDSHAKLLTNPRIRVRNHDKAKILIGERVPNITSTATSTGFLSQSVSYIDVGLTLNVEPTIYLDDNVGIKLSLEVSSIINTITTQTGTTAYEIGTRNATTALRLKNGETDVLAGLIGSTERTSGNKLPGLGELPVLGRLFGATTDDDEKTEI
ncbi:MAG TPA: secretin and TonB N-terminal domain-containing protein, partial [Magnetospirillaceae bacterium]|nr:secretin and TonB N-terminal domain-containing protein [Magnetospirillaceae bacterium]